MKRYNLFSVLSMTIYVLLLSSCAKQVTPAPGPDNPPTPNPEVGKFDFATTSDINLTVNYGILYPVLFEVYITNPITTTDSQENKGEGLKPAFRAITDNSGVFSGTILLPTYVKTVYLYTQYLGIPTCVELPVGNSGITFDLSQPAAISSKAANRVGQIIGGGFKTIDSWNMLGKPNKLLPRIRLDGQLMSDIMYSLPEGSKSVGNYDPHGLLKEDVAIGDIKILKNTKINLIFMHEGAGWLNSLAYYCFPTNSPAGSARELTRVIALPNCSYGYSGGELSSGDRVQLKYWNGTTFVDEFPAGTTIGWALIANSFRTSTGNIDPSGSHIVYSNPAFNPEVTKKQHCIALYDKNNKVIALGFEDTLREKPSSSDNDFNDVVFYIQTDVDGGVDSGGIPALVPSPTPAPLAVDNFIEYNGSLSFEDLWPSQGDYDMNDMVIEYHSTHYRNSNNEIVKIVDKFVPQNYGASMANGFGYQLGVSGSSVQSMKIESDYTNSLSLFKTDSKGLELNQSLATIMLFEDMHKLIMQHQPGQKNTKAFTITTEFTTPVTAASLGLPPYNPFIVCKSGDASSPQRGIEVHLPNKRPTALANTKLLGTNTDKSNPAKGIYYISSDNYMFAMNLPINDFYYPAEGQRIDKLYGCFASWVSSGGKTDADWYLKK